MKRAHAGAVARELERLVDPGTLSGLSEGQVLARFVERQDPVAFEAIVVRHGPMVLSVCRQMLRDTNDVDDAFQATFVIFMEKAGGLRHPERLGPWLYGVAYRVALRAGRRRRTERLPVDLIERSSESGPLEVEQLTAVHEEIGRLPEKYRLPIVLCCIEEETHGEAASRLGWPVGTVHGRLSRAKDLLRDRLKRRGMVIPASIDRQSPAASKPHEKVVPEPLLRSTVALSSDAIPSQLLTLVKGALSAMLFEKVKSTGLLVALTALGLASATTALLAFQESAEKADPATVARSAQAPERREPNIDKAYHKPAGKPENAAIAEPNNDGQEEAAAVEVGKLRADIELLELNAEYIKGKIRTGLTLIGQLEEQTDSVAADAEGRKRELDQRKEWTDKARDKVALWRKEYGQDKEQIARYRYRITAQGLNPRDPLSEKGDSSESLGEVLRRIDRLEAKVDRIAKSIAGGRGR